MRFFFACLLMIIAAPSFGYAKPALSPDAGIAQMLPLRPISIQSGSKKHHFQVMVARSEDEQEVGLMWRKSLAPDEGMIFPFASSRVASFWMRNTLIPLDIIFIRSDGTIANIAANAVPLSLTPISSDGKVKAVLELAGGRAEALGIKRGDKVRW